MSAPPPQLASGRSCAGCTMCCKLMGIGALSKPADQWCTHCKVGEGCGVYETRPDECRSFNCMWLTEPNMPDEWAPKHSRIVVGAGRRGVVVHVDPSRAGAWRKAPFYPVIRRWAAMAAPRGDQVLVREGQEFFAILPDRDKPLGKLVDNWVAVSTQTQTPLGIQYDVVVMQKDDPAAIKAMQAQGEV